MDVSTSDMPLTFSFIVGGGEEKQKRKKNKRGLHCKKFVEIMQV